MISERMESTKAKLNVGLSKETGLVLFNRLDSVVKYVADTLDLKSGTRPSVNSNDGYNSGKVAGHAMNLNGGNANPNVKRLVG